MGRFKFPGKPPKTVTRKRIKVLGGGSELSLQKDSVIITENTNNGNSLLNNTSGDHDKVIIIIIIFFSMINERKKKKGERNIGIYYLLQLINEG